MNSENLTSQSFYSNLHPFKNFSELLDDRHYVSVPREWFILMTDVKGSTEAIKAGLYKQVNMLGAASITCVLNASNRLELPFVFGGDGATMVIPETLVSTALEELGKLKKLALEDFGLSLRVGALALDSDLLQGHSMKIAKYELSPGNFIAQFKGSALSVAESCIKRQDPRTLQPTESPQQSKAPNLDGLSCRISPVQSRNGKVISLICQGTTKSTERTMADLVRKIQKILDNDFSNACPIHMKNMKWSLISETFFDEVKFQRGEKSFLKQVYLTFKEMLLANALIKFDFVGARFSAPKYKAEVLTNSDFKKFDESLRMVLDCTEKQIELIVSALTELESEGLLIYGTHISAESLVTCMVFSASQNQHTHFIDGANGGYSHAALQLKEKKLKA